VVSQLLPILRATAACCHTRSTASGRKGSSSRRAPPPAINRSSFTTSCCSSKRHRRRRQQQQQQRRRQRRCLQPRRCRAGALEPSAEAQEPRRRRLSFGSGGWRVTLQRSRAHAALSKREALGPGWSYRNLLTCDAQSLCLLLMVCAGAGRWLEHRTCCRLVCQDDCCCPPSACCPPCHRCCMQRATSCSSRATRCVITCAAQRRRIAGNAAGARINKATAVTLASSCTPQPSARRTYDDCGGGGGGESRVTSALACCRDAGTCLRDTHAVVDDTAQLQRRSTCGGGWGGSGRDSDGEGRSDRLMMARRLRQQQRRFT
jgi:hypothetical protein